MKLASFCLLTALALLYAGLTIVETVTYHKWEKAVNDQKYTQAEATYFDHLNSVLEEFIKRTAILSQHDPALAQLLKDHNINVVTESSTAPPAPAVNGFDANPLANPPQSPPDKPEQIPTTAAHP